MTPWVTPWVAKKETQPSKGQKRRRRRCEDVWPVNPMGPSLISEVPSLMGKITICNGKKDKKHTKNDGKIHHLTNG